MNPSCPNITHKELNAVNNVLKQRTLSSFVGAKHDNVLEMLHSKSKDLNYWIDGKTFLGGNYVRKFEADFAKMLDVDYAVSVNSATSGLITALLALKPDKDLDTKTIITTPYSFTASAAAISLAGYTPVFVNIDKDTFIMDEKAIEKAIRPNTKAILHVSWCGNAGNLKRIKEIADYHNLTLIEDASQSILNKYDDKFIGTIGDIGVFSFNEPKNMTTGEGGMVVTNNEMFAVRSRMIRNHGEVIPNAVDNRYDDIIGYNFRLPEVLAVIGIEQLKKLPALNKIRKINYEYILANIGDLDFLQPQKITNSEYYPYCMSFRVKQVRLDTVSRLRDKLVKDLTDKNIPVSSGIPRLLFDHPCYSNLTMENPVNFAYDVWNSYISFFQIGYPNTVEDQDLLIKALKEVEI